MSCEGLNARPRHACWLDPTWHAIACIRVLTHVHGPTGEEPLQCQFPVLCVSVLCGAVESPRERCGGHFATRAPRRPARRAGRRRGVRARAIVINLHIRTARSACDRGGEEQMHLDTTQ